ncbi:MAG: imidazole glycerol phosphate synthase subunit HisH [Rhodospirillaceae bacterium]|jgi:glutamine amidotransferase|uniref:imidazole glycerol phosphate synthase subunit HisH n=1 Tax=Hwanghaeella sp. 1Z406 TaxID=3402811 RepID=UPI000C538829|nr:imidazole glycerol phosphate synthase subunit HisH [Rhodospirillales bacterium]MAX47370.1 imidazole glycerol phosphate synthase subunit HisH [Rhodospirillaceae bacterium]|tara:strand:- start:439 stop:1071 length:633 start_codon:yes stop_codon:yes gene_type:complete
MLTTIVDYGSGNLHSAAKAFERMAGPSDRICVTDDVSVIATADRIVLPGVGAFGDCRAGLMKVEGLYETLQKTVIDQARPFMGICVGMQLMATVGEEHGTHDGFGWISGTVTPIRPDDPALKVPHMGWNNLVNCAPHPVLDGISASAYCYFVHSFHLKTDKATDCLAQVDYGERLTAMVGRDNMVGVQFHPEKSQAPGLRLISNFLTWTP